MRHFQNIRNVWKNGKIQTILSKLRDRANDFLRPINNLVNRWRKDISFWLLAAAFLSLTLIFFPQFRTKAGSASFYLLLLILFLGPVSQITRLEIIQSAMRFRRPLGIWMGTLAIAHSVSFFFKFKFPLTFIFSGKFWIQNGMISPVGWGMMAFVLTLLLLLTSNNFSMRTLGRNWKRLHRLAYLLLLLIALHIIFVKFQIVKAIAAITIYAIVKIAAVKGFKI